MEKLSVKADVNSLGEVQAFVDRILEEHECSMKAQMQIDIAVEELFVNIAHYAYPSGKGDAIIEVDTESDTECVKITFEDQGVPYDPLKHEDPDVTLSAEDRAIGGLGIFMVKQSMDDISYEYTDNKNRLTITKKIR
jgi:anti-sigma regulatory factor (Ser/Thr protein kinase)